MKVFFVAMLLMATIVVLSYGAPIEQNNETAHLAVDESSSVPAVKPLKKSHKSKVAKIAAEIDKKKPTSPKENKKVKVTDSAITWNVPAIEVEHRPLSLTGHAIISDGLFGDSESYRFLHPFERF